MTSSKPDRALTGDEELHVAIELAAIARQLSDLGARAALLAAQNADGGRSDRRRAKAVSRIDCARRIRQVHDLRGAAFGAMATMFGDPAFDILLLVYVRTLERRPISVSGVCTAGDMKSTTGLRWIANLIDKGLLTRIADIDDRRREFIELTPAGRAIMDRYLDAVRG